jgi:hypothetical protein
MRSSPNFAAWLSDPAPNRRASCITYAHNIYLLLWLIRTELAFLWPWLSFFSMECFLVEFWSHRESQHRLTISCILEWRMFECSNPNIELQRIWIDGATRQIFGFPKKLSYKREGTWWVKRFATILLRLSQTQCRNRYRTIVHTMSCTCLISKRSSWYTIQTPIKLPPP